MRTRLASLLVSAAALAAPAIVALGVPAAAHAGFFAGEPVDGPSADIVRVDDVELARDGSGAIAFVKRDGGVEHLFVSRLVRGVFQRAQRVDAGLPGPSGAASVAASDGGRLAVVFTSGGQTFAAVRPSSRRAWTAPQQLGAAGGATAVDMSLYGTAYAVFTSGGDLRAARLDRTGTGFTVLGAALDIDPAADAGAGTGRPRVAVSADGAGIAVWGERGKVYERRLVGLDVSPVPQEAGLGEVEGHAGGAADLPDVDLEDNSSYAWVVFRQQFADGAGTTGRALMRRLRGSRFEDPAVVDGLGWGGPSVDATAIDLSGRGDGLLAVGATDGVARASALRLETLGPVTPLGGSGSPTQPALAASEQGRHVAGWFSAADTTVHARLFEDPPKGRTPPVAGPDVLVATPTLGTVDGGAGLVAAGDRLGDALVVFVQSGADGRRVVAAGHDLPPGAPKSFRMTSRPLATKRPVLRWGAAREPWGPLTYSVEIDGRTVGTTGGTSFVAPRPLRNGRHRWRAIAVDRHGSATAGRVHTFRVSVSRKTKKGAAKP
jgi:hypothetical protein